MKTPMLLFNTLTRQKQEFKPASQVKLYTCGPTVYHYAHIGNLRNVIFNDTLRRSLEVNGYKVDHVMNITDVGHLTSDADEGEDKLEKGAKQAGKTVWQVAEFYTDAFNRHAKMLNVLAPTKVVKATDAIETQKQLVQTLLDKDFAYITKQAIYFDVTKLDDYGKLSGQNLGDKVVGVRKEVVTDPQKHNPHDFALWFFTVGHFAGHTMHWPSPWGDGFPGWHLECSAIIHQELGEPIDIHTGGVDHIGTHHTNEIAQSEAAFGKPLANYWLHNEFLQFDDGKMSKSDGNTLNLDELVKKGYDPLAFRLLMLQSHYRSQQNFTWEALDGAAEFLKSLYAWADLQFQPAFDDPKRGDYSAALKAVIEAVSDDLNTAKALSRVSQLTNEQTVNQKELPELLRKLDHVLGLKLNEREDITAHQKNLIEHREAARKDKQFEVADKLRQDLLKQGIEVEDTAQGPRWRRA
jgi:cysteinyl-tRNA synthetase